MDRHLIEVLGSILTHLRALKNNQNEVRSIIEQNNRTVVTEDGVGLVAPTVYEPYGETMGGMYYSSDTLDMMGSKLMELMSTKLTAECPYCGSDAEVRNG